MEYEHEAVLTTDWNRIKNLADFYRQWPQFSCDVGMRTIADIMAKPSCDGGVRDLDDITGFAGYYEPSGWYVTALEDAGEMSPVDLFCVTQRRGGADQSRRLSYDDLRQRLYEDVLAAVNVGSMAYMEKYDYALAGHRHDDMYSKVEFAPAAIAGPTENVCTCYISSDWLSCSHSGNWSNVGCNPAHKGAVRVVSPVMKARKYSQPAPPRPAIGTLRFVGAATVQSAAAANLLTLTSSGKPQVNPYGSDNKIRPDYDGWVFANGVKILNRDGALNAAKAAFGQGSDGKINVPNVADFFVLAEGEADLTPSGKQAGLKQHVHRMGVHGFSGTIKLDSDRCDMNSTNACGGGMYVHNGTYQEGDTKVSTTGKLPLYNASFSGLKSTECAARGGDPCPAHVRLPLMVYIGGELDAYYEVERRSSADSAQPPQPAATG